MSARLSALAVLALTACTIREVPQGAEAGMDGARWDTVRVSERPSFGTAAIAVAEAEGYFADQRLVLELEAAAVSTAQLMPALEQGKLDAVAGVLSIGMLNAMAHGAPVRIVADRSHFSPTGCSQTWLVARRGFGDSLARAGALGADGQLAHPALLRGRTIAVGENTNSGFMVEQLLQRGGMSFADLRVVNLPESAKPQALRSAAIDLATITEPALTPLRKEGQRPIASAGRMMPDGQQSVLVYGPTLLEREPDVGRRFMLAFLAGVRRYNEGPTHRNVEIVARHTGLDAAQVREMCWTPLRPDGAINVESVLAFQRWANRRGQLDRVVPVEQFWEPGFARWADSVLGAGALGMG